MPVYKDNHGKWYFKVSVKGVQYLKRGFNSKTEAKENEMLFLLEIDKIKDIKIVKLYSLIEKYKQHQKKKLKPTTYYNKMKNFDKYIVNNFPDIDIHRLTMQHFNRFRSRLSKEKIKEKNRILNMCVDFFEYIDIYYDIRIPFAKRLDKFVNYIPDSKILETRNKNIEIDLFKQYYHASEDYYKILLLTIYVTGVRLSELRGIEVKAFNFKEKYLYVYKVTTGKAGIGKSIDLVPKTESSIRKVFLPDGYIKKVKLFIKENGLRKSDRLFFSENKKIPLSENSIHSHLRVIEKNNELEHITLHGLRHGIASYLYHEGISDTDIGKYLGHKKNNVTMDVYIDLTKERQQKIVSIIDKFIKELD